MQSGSPIDGTNVSLVLQALGIFRQSVPLRYASRGVPMITLAKVLLLDMSDLTGLFRVASFPGDPG